MVDIESINGGHRKKLQNRASESDDMNDVASK